MTYLNSPISENYKLTCLLVAVLCCREDEEVRGCDNTAVEMDGDDAKQTSL